MWNGSEMPSAERERPALDLRLLLVRGVRRSWPWVCGFVVLGGLSASVYGLVQPNAFVSHAKLLLRVGAREQMTSESLVGADGDRRAASPTMIDELQMLADTAIFERVASAIGAREILEPADPARDDGPLTSAPVRLLHRVQALSVKWTAPAHLCTGAACSECLRLATKTLIANTKVANEPGSNVIQLEHSSSSPERARAVVSALASAFSARHREQFSVQSLIATNTRELAAAKETRDAALDAYVEHVNGSVIEDIDPQSPAIQTELTALQSELFAARVRQKAIARQLSSLTGRLDAAPAEIEAPGPVIMVPNEEYETQLMLKRSLLAQKQAVPLEVVSIVETQRRARVLDAQIADVELALQRLPKAVAQNAELRENLGNAVLSTRVDELELEDQELAVKVDLLQERVSEKQARASELRKQLLVERLRRDELVATRDAAQKAYAERLARFTVLAALGNIELHEDPNLRLLQSPTLDPEKTGPRRIALLLKGLFAGLFAGLSFAVLRQGLDRTLAYPDSFANARGVPVLGVVPVIPALKRGARETVLG